MTDGIYWERQIGNNCRIHSLNAFFGEKKVSDTDFERLCKEYDTLIPGLASIQMDGFAECRSIVSYIVDIYANKYMHLVPINMRNIHSKNRHFWNYDRLTPFLGKPGGILNYFEFNRDHIWINRFINNNWYKIDSMSGITTINKQRSFGENGYLLVFETDMIFIEIEYLIDLIKHKEDFDDLDIAYNNLYHLLKRITLEYDPDDAIFNTKITSLKLVFKLLDEFILLNRKVIIKNKDVITIKRNLKNVMTLIEF